MALTHMALTHMALTRGSSAVTLTGGNSGARLACVRLACPLLDAAAQLFADTRTHLFAETRTRLFAHTLTSARNLVTANNAKASSLLGADQSYRLRLGDGVSATRVGSLGAAYR